MNVCSGTVLGGWLVLEHMQYETELMFHCDMNCLVAPAGACVDQQGHNGNEESAFIHSHPPCIYLQQMFVPEEVPPV